MKGLLQRVSQAAVSVDGEVVAEIGAGILLLLGIAKQDGDEHVARLLNKVLNYRVFPDDQGKMNRSLLDIQGELLVVSQFTLVADTSRGLRAGFSEGADPDQAKLLYNSFVRSARQQLEGVAEGIFGAEMRVSLCNQGPVTFMLEV